MNVQGLCCEYDAGSPWISAKLVVIDFETTGLDADKDRVLEVGLAGFENGELAFRHNWLVNPGMPIPEQARQVHGITDEEVAGAPSFAAMLPEALRLLEGGIPVAYNADFDRRFWFTELRRAGEGATAANIPALRADVVWLDPLVWAREVQKYQKSKKLVDVCARLGIDLTQAHRAGGDAEAAGRVMLALAPHLPRTYGELVRLQQRYAAKQEADYAAYRARRVGS